MTLANNLLIESFGTSFPIFGGFMVMIALITIGIVPEITVCDKLETQNIDSCNQASNQIHLIKYGTLSFGLGMLVIGMLIHFNNKNAQRSRS